MTDKRQHLARGEAQRESWNESFGWSKDDYPWWRKVWSWKHHPFANTHVSFWRHVKHEPKWKASTVTIGELGHGPEDAHMRWVQWQCKRCAFVLEEDDKPKTWIEI